MQVRKAVIPVAGFGTRFLPATKATPKEMFPLVDKPLAQYAVEEAATAGIEEIIFITGQAKRAIEDHFDRNFELEYLLRKKGKEAQLSQIIDISEIAQFAYVRQKEMRGFGDAILQTRNLVGDEPFVVITPDDVFNGGGKPAIAEVIEAFHTTKSPVVGVKEVPWEHVHQYGIYEGEETGPGLRKVSRTVEKPKRAEAKSQLAAVGRYVFTPDIFPILEKLEPGVEGEVQFNDAINQLAQDRDVYTVELKATRHDAGDKLGYLQAVVDYALEREDLGEDFRAFLKSRLEKDK